MDLRQDEFKYLAIKNWHRFQGGRMRDEDKPRAWIKNYLDKEADIDYGRLTCLQRYILDGCCRLRGRLGKNLPNDATYIARALHTVSTDRPHVGYAVATLIARGFLILSNQQNDIREERRGEEKERRGESARERAANPPPENGVAASSPDGSEPTQNRPQDDALDPEVPQHPQTHQATVEHQEPENGHSTPPAVLTVHQLARGMMDELGIAGGQSDLAIWSQAIALKSRKSGMSIAEAYVFILRKAEDAQLSGEFSKPTFWMKDAVYDHKPTRSKSHAATQEFAKRGDREFQILRASNGARS